MEEGMSSMVSKIGGNRNLAVGSDSSVAANDSSDGASKRASKRFKGVVEQPNGHWGAQIYANHERVWLGTFSSENEAARAYDSAATKLRGGDCHRNFPWTKDTFEEPHFQSQYTKEDVLTMIKEGSYQAKFLEYRRSRSKTESVGTDTQLGSLAKEKSNENAKLLKRFLFQKELTPSDVGKLNRLVIPIKFAERYFPKISEAIRAKGNSCSIPVTFYDRMMRSWTFRFCFWQSSRSYVFTKGWSRFVKTHNLKANDTISFLQCQRRQLGQNSKEPLSFCMISVTKVGDRNDDVGCLVEKNNANNYHYDVGNIAVMNLERNCKLDALSRSIISGEEEEDVHAEIMAKKEGSLRLFGVEISYANAVSQSIMS